MKEEELAKHFEKYFADQGFEVFPEVTLKYDGIVDFFARKGS